MVSILEVVFSFKEYASQWKNINALIFGMCVWQRQVGVDGIQRRYSRR